jgi:hypothetical protein
MDETVEGGKELLAETVRAFKTGLHGQEYTPGATMPRRLSATKS